MAAVGEDAEAALAGVGLLVDHLHADATQQVLAALHCKRELHVLLVGLDAGLQGAERKGPSAHREANCQRKNSFQSGMKSKFFIHK